MVIGVSVVEDILSVPVRLEKTQANAWCLSYNAQVLIEKSPQKECVTNSVTTGLSHRPAQVVLQRTHPPSRRPQCLLYIMGYWTVAMFTRCIAVRAVSKLCNQHVLTKRASGSTHNFALNQFTGTACAPTNQFTWQWPKCCSRLDETRTICPRHVIVTRNPFIICRNDSVTADRPVDPIVFLKTWFSRKPCAASLRIAVLSTRRAESATWGTMVDNSWMALFSLSRRFFSARFLASRPFVLQIKIGEVLINNTQIY